jgi:predicted transcriptional regulator
MSAKRQAIEALEELPDSASIEDALERLFLLYKIERGLEQVEEGRLTPQDEAKKRMAPWLE